MRPGLLRFAFGSVLCAGGLAVGLLLGAERLTAQPAPPAETFEQRLVKVVADMGTRPRLASLTPQQRRDMTIFVFGNMLYAVAHEMGHTVVTEMQLPVLGREEDAADSFAIVAGTKLMTNVSLGALIEAGKSWFLLDLSDKKSGAMTTFYEAHGMNLQRAYQIVCFLYGADPEKFKVLAEATNLPARRQQTCKEDYALAVWAWETVLEPYRRTPDKARTTIEISYQEGKDELEVYEKVFKELQFLEYFSTMASDRFVWRAPFAMTMETCGVANAWWSLKNRKITVCYELVEQYVQLYLQFMNDPEIVKRMRALKPPQ